MKVTVKTLDGREKEFDFSEKTTVRELKEQIESAMDIPLDSQRLIYQGKVLKDDQVLGDYGVDGKVLRLVKNPPPTSVTAESSEQSHQASAADATAAPAEEPRRRKSYLKEDYMHVGTAGKPAPPNLNAITKGVVEDVVESMTESGHLAMVTATVHTLSTDGRPVNNASYTSTTFKGSAEPAGGAAAQKPPKPDLTEEEKRERQQEEEEMRQRRERLAGFRERIRAQQKRGREQTNILEIYQHMTSARRALQGAEGILTEFLGPPAPEEQVSSSNPQQQAAETPMEVVEEGGATGGGEGDDGKPVYSVGEDGRPRQRILTEQGMLLPAGSQLYASLCEDVVKIQRRSIPLFEKYVQKMQEERKYSVDVDGIEAVRSNSYMVQTIQRFNNAMGQAHTALSKVQVTLDGEPPRVVSLVPQRRSTNPLLTLLNQVPSSDDEDDAPPRRHGGRSGLRRGQDDDDDDEPPGHSMASMLGSLLAARAAMRMNQEEEQATSTPSQAASSQPSQPVASGGSGAGGDDDDDDDDDVNPFLPGPVALLQTLMRRRQERERQEQEQQEQQKTVVIQADESFLDTISRIRQAIGGPESETMPPTVVGNLVERCMKTMSISEVVMVFGGNPDPLKTIHKTLREFIKENSTDGEEPTCEMIPRAISRFLEFLPETLRSLDPPLPVRADVDFPESARKCCKYMLKEGFELIIGLPDDDDTFALKIYTWAMKMGTLFTCVLRACLKSPNDLTTSMKRLADMMFPDNNTPGVLTMLNSQSLVDYFVEDANTATFTPEEINCHVVKVGDELETEDETEPSADQNVSLEGWPSAMPQEWVPVVLTDQYKMSKMPLQPPLSTAYLSGVPAKRRKQLESGEAEVLSMAEVLDSSLSSAIDSAGVTPQGENTVEGVVKAARDNANLVEAIGQEFHAEVRRRLEQDSDYSPERFPNSQKFYQPNK